MEEPLVLHGVEAQDWFRSLAFDAHLALPATAVSAALASSRFAFLPPLFSVSGLCAGPHSRSSAQMSVFPAFMQTFEKMHAPITVDANS